MRRLLLLVIASTLCATAQAEQHEFDFDAPPFWTVSYEELVDLKTPQISTYLKGFEKVTKQVPEMEAVTFEQMLAATDQKSAWIDLQTRFYRFCSSQAKRSKELCDEAAGLRKKMYSAASNQKLENRIANAKREKEERERNAPRAKPGRNQR